MLKNGSFVSAPDKNVYDNEFKHNTNWENYNYTKWQEHASAIYSRYKRFNIKQTVFWSNKHNISYSLFKKTIPPQLNVKEIDITTRLAFKLWQDVVSYDTNVNIVKFVNVGEDNDDANIKIVFAKGDHDDKFNFDGPGGILAHAFQPPIGAIHFDADETWLTDSNYTPSNGTLYLQTLTHEIGHALGLFHSSDNKSVMYQFYNDANDKLAQDDINGLDQLYAHNPYLKTKEYQIPTWVYESTSNAIDEVCSKIPSSVITIRGEYYIFLESTFWRYKDFNLTKLLDNRNIKSSLWPELCQIVAGSTHKDKIIFIDNFIWYEYNTTTLDKVFILRNRYNVLFEEDNQMYGVVNGTFLYRIESAQSHQFVGRVADKFRYVDNITWVVINNDIISVGMGRGKWTFTKQGSDTLMGVIYESTGTIEPLMQIC